MAKLKSQECESLLALSRMSPPVQGNIAGNRPKEEMFVRSKLFPAILGVLLLAGCGTRRQPDGLPVSHSGTAEPESPVIAIQDKPVSIAEQMKGQEGIVTLTMTEAGFSPNILNVSIGDRVKIYLKNDSPGEHNLVIERFGIATSLMAPRAENYVEFTASEKGQWPFFSDAPGQVEEPFRGLLKVE